MVRLFGVDPLIALLGSAPGGTLGMSLVGAELGVGAAVAAIHAFRLIAVLLTSMFLAGGRCPPCTLPEGPPIGSRGKH